MTAMLSSARLRRRLAWGGAFALVAGSVALLIVAFPGPKRENERLTKAAPDIVRVPKQRSFQPRETNVLRVAQRFLLTAVARHHVADSWDLAAPSLREGFTKKSWAKGTIPVVPFPVSSARWQLSWSYTNEVGLRVAVFPPPKAKQRPTVFDMVVRKFRRRGNARWLVSSMTPAPSASGDYGESRNTWVAGSGVTKGGRTKFVPPNHSGALWLLVPGGIMALALVALAAVGIKSWRGAAVYKAYVRERQTSS